MTVTVLLFHIVHVLLTISLDLPKAFKYGDIVMTLLRVPPSTRLKVDGQAWLRMVVGAVRCTINGKLDVRLASFLPRCQL